MINYLKFCLTFGALMSGFSLTTLAAQSMQEVQEYCQSLHAGMDEADARMYIDECISEQKSYLEQDYASQDDSQAYQDEPAYPDYNEQEDTSYQGNSYNEETYQEPEYTQESSEPDTYQDQNCYAKVDEQVQKLLDNDPNSPFDYDQLIEQCLKGTY